ncbi:hypothetical protein [Micromonospora sp. NPDC047187]|uniref:hypothetical protein n=1 Tax=Micromonospora sp. NPDC047187 TaxID=3155262 RepID=UPI0033C59645
MSGWDGRWPGGGNAEEGAGSAEGRDDVEVAERALREVVADARRVGAIWPLVQALSALARLRVAGRPDEPVRYAAEALADQAAAWVPPWDGPARMVPVAGRR